MSIFVKYYGKQFGNKEVYELSKDEWRYLINSNSGLFKRRKTSPAIIGPTLDKNGKVIGDVMSMETTYFYQVASDEQAEFFEEMSESFIEKRLPGAMAEYILTVTGSIDKWKEDIRNLIMLERFLKQEGVELEKEHSLLQRDARPMVNVPRAIEWHLPELFKTLRDTDMSLKSILKKIESVEQSVISEERLISGYLAVKRAEMPFLFG